MDGHQVHYIAALKYAHRRPSVAGSARVAAAGESLMFHPDSGEPIGPLYNHRMGLVAATLEDTGGRAEWIASLRLLRCPVPTGRAVYSMSTAPLDPCPPVRVQDEEFLT